MNENISPISPITNIARYGNKLYKSQKNNKKDCNVDNSFDNLLNKEINKEHNRYEKIKNNLNND